MKDEDFIERLRRGESKAFEQLVDEYSKKVYNLCLGFLRDPDWSDDIAQEVFIEIFKSIKNFRKEASIGTWIYRITVNKCLSFERKRKKIELMDYFHLIGLEKKKFWMREALHPGIEETERSLEKWTFRKLELLPESQRIALTLNKIKGLKHPDISIIMGISISAVESLIFRAKEKIRNWAKKEGIKH
jgi:RNA polymerase sigma-70 factor, ECF subfamily